MQRPQLIDPVITDIYNLTLPGSMKAFVEKFPVMEVDQEEGYYEWMLQGQHEKNLPLVDATDIAGSVSAVASTLTGQGANGAQFYVIFGEDYFDNGDVLRGEMEDYHLLIKGKDTVGQGYRYRVELITDNSALSMPAEELEVGRRFSKDYNIQPGTLSYQGTRPNFSSPFRMRNRTSLMRMQYDVAGSMIGKGKNEPLEFAFKMPDGSVEKVWTNYHDFVANYQFDNQFARMCLYGKKNWDSEDRILNRDEKTRFEIASGAGLFEQIAPGNVHYYNKYDVDWHVDMLLDMGVGKLERGKRHITIGTGEFGAVEIHKQIQEKALAWTTVSANAPLINKTSSGNLGTGNTLGFGAQFNQYVSYNGVVLNVEIIPFFDDDIRFPLRHPDGKGVVESHRMIAFDYGGDAGIYRVQPKGAKEAWGYIEGLRSPYSPSGEGASRNISSALDGYTVVKAKWGGMMVKDPTKIVDLRYNFTR